MHPNNLHKKSYDFQSLVKALPALEQFVIKNPSEELTINFSDRASVIALNKAILKYHYQIEYWDVMDGYLCPAVPGRAEYIHHLNDLLSENEKHKKICCLDIGTGASIIYPLLGVKIYNWKFIATDIDPKALRAAKGILEANNLSSRVAIRHQANPEILLANILKPMDRVELIMCNPPFYKSLEEAQSHRSDKNLNLDIQENTFGGNPNELWCDGGEIRFIQTLIDESSQCRSQLGWISSLVANKNHLDNLQKRLKYVQVREVKIIPLELGNKKSRILAWRF